MPQQGTSLFIFRRDLRLHDNIGLLQAAKQSNVIIPIFIFDPRQIEAKNDYRSINCIQFMLESLTDLEQQIKKMGGRLFFFYGDPEKIIKKIIQENQIDTLFLNRDYTPFSTKRDRALEIICHKNNCSFISCDDALLNRPEDIKTKSGTPYAIFTPFYKHCLKNFPIARPQKTKKFNFYRGTIDGSQRLSTLSKKILPNHNPDIHVHGGSAHGYKLLRTAIKLTNYKNTRDYPNIPTSNLSAHLKFGTLSVREVFHAFAKAFRISCPLISQLYWRDFFYHVAFHYPSVFGHAFQKKYDRLTWSKNKKLFEAWCSGNTGFPIVDAGMRQLNATGYMHNRVRMIVSSFLTKDLHIDWRWGEKYFAQKLVDYDPCINNGNWQWAASTGCDAQPYFRIFNPWIQQKKFDLDCQYIKHWIPELKKVDTKIIHNWFNPKYRASSITYAEPIIDHKTETARSIKWFKSAK